MEGGYDQQICCDALPLATDAPEVPAGAHGDGDGGGGGDTGDAEGSSEGYLVAVVVGAFCLGMVAVLAVLGRSHMRRMDALCQQVNALGQKVDAKGAGTEEYHNVNLPGADTLVSRVHGALAENTRSIDQRLDALSTKIDGSRLGSLMSHNSSFERW